MRIEPNRRPWVFVPKVSRCARRSAVSGGGAGTTRDGLTGAVFEAALVASSATVTLLDAAPVVGAEPGKEQLAPSLCGEPERGCREVRRLAGAQREKEKAEERDEPLAGLALALFPPPPPPPPGEQASGLLGIDHYPAVHFVDRALRPDAHGCERVARKELPFNRVLQRVVQDCALSPFSRWLVLTAAGCDFEEKSTAASTVRITSGRARSATGRELLSSHRIVRARARARAAACRARGSWNVEGLR